MRQAAEYYRDILGFSLDPVDGLFQPTQDEPNGVYGIVERSGVSIHFEILWDDLTHRTRQTFERDVYLYVHDFDSVFNELQERGAAISQPLRMTPYGLREIVVEDLNGYRRAFGQNVSVAAPNT